MERKVQCFKCRDTFTQTKDLFIHIKNVHNISGKSKYVCTCTCTEIFTQFGAYKNHVNMCFDKIAVDERLQSTDQAQLITAYNAVAMEDDELHNFKNSVEQKAFQLVSKLSATMILPRDLVYRIVKYFDEFLGTLVDGVKSIIIPKVVGSEKRTVKEFANVVGSSFSNSKTEWIFEKELRTADVIASFDRCELLADVLNNPNTAFEVEDLESDRGKKIECPILMPISFQIKKFLELPNVLKTMIDNAANIRQTGRLNHFINGSLWKEKMKNYKEDQIVIPYFYYSDGAQLNHPLGPHIRNGSEDFQYYSFPTIPFEYQSRLENIFLSYLFPEKLYSEFGLEEIFGNLIEELTKLATDGIIVKIDSTEKQVFLVCGALLADNKEANTILGFAKSHTANKFCRFCQMNIKETKRSTTENSSIRRNRVNFDEDVTKHSLCESGIHVYSVFNKVPFFHVTESSAEDLTHTVEEGIVKYNLTEALSILIYEDGEITLEELNRRIKTFSYGEEEKSNKPHLILKDHIDNRKLRMTAAETANFIQNITLMIGDCISEDNYAWQLILNTVKFYDYCYLPCYEQKDLAEWKGNIDEMHTLYLEVGYEDLKPVHHYATHFPSDTEKFGPLRFTKTIRFEGKHREFKSYAKNSNNRVNLSYSIAKKAQYNFAERLLQSKGLEDKFETKYNPGSIKEKVLVLESDNTLEIVV